MQKKYYQILFLKVLKIFRKYFHFPKSKNLKIFDFVFWKSEISKSEISKSEKYFLKMENISKTKIENFQIFSILENENIFWNFSKLLKIKFDNIFFAYSRNLNLHHVIQSPAMNSAWPVTIFRLFEFQLQQIFTAGFTHYAISSGFEKIAKKLKNKPRTDLYATIMMFIHHAKCLGSLSAWF